MYCCKSLYSPINLCMYPFANRSILFANAIFFASSSLFDHFFKNQRLEKSRCKQKAATASEMPSANALPVGTKKSTTAHRHSMAYPEARPLHKFLRSRRMSCPPCEQTWHAGKRPLAPAHREPIPGARRKRLHWPRSHRPRKQSAEFDLNDVPRFGSLVPRSHADHTERVRAQRLGRTGLARIGSRLEHSILRQ